MKVIRYKDFLRAQRRAKSRFFRNASGTRDEKHVIVKWATAFKHQRKLRGVQKAPSRRTVCSRCVS